MVLRHHKKGAWTWRFTERRTQRAGAAVAAVPALALPLDIGSTRMRPKSVDDMNLAYVGLVRATAQEGGRAKKTTAGTVTIIPRCPAGRAFL